jgi:hypothetical protein
VRREDTMQVPDSEAESKTDNGVAELFERFVRD